VGVSEGRPEAVLPDHMGRADYTGYSVNQVGRWGGCAEGAAQHPLMGCVCTHPLRTRHTDPGHTGIPRRVAQPFPTLIALLLHWLPTPWAPSCSGYSFTRARVPRPHHSPPSLPAAHVQAARFMDACAHGGMVCCEVELAERVLQLWRDGASTTGLDVITGLDELPGASAVKGRGGLAPPQVGQINWHWEA